MAVTITLPSAEQAVEAGTDPLFGWKLLAEQAVFAYLRKHGETHLPGDALQPPLRIEGQERDWQQPGEFTALLAEYRDKAEKATTKEDAAAFRERGGRLKLEPLEEGDGDSHAIAWTATIRLPAKRPGANEKESSARYTVRLPASLVPKQVVEVAREQAGADAPKVKRARKTPEALPYTSGKPRVQAKEKKPKVKIKRH